MRAVAVAVVLLVASAAHAKRVVHIPTLRELCPGGEDWRKTTACFARHGKHEVLRDDATAKLIRFAPGTRIAGIYLYLVKDKRWYVHGDLRIFQEHELVGFQRVTLGKYGAYRIDAGIAQASAISLDGETSQMATYRIKRTLICVDKRGCYQMMTACDVLVRGKAYYSFRGTLAVEDGMLKLVGDRRNAGTHCRQAEDIADLRQYVN